MISKISLCLIDELGEQAVIEKTSNTRLETILETLTADLFSAICFRNNNLADEELKIAEKFYFAVNLQNYLKEINENASRPAND